jgi:hypothetical protein
MITEIIIFLAVTIALFGAVFIINAIINRLLKKKLTVSEDLEKSISINIIKSLLFVSVAILINEVNISLHSISKIIEVNNTGGGLMFQSLSYFSIFIFIIFLTFSFIFILAYIMFSVIFKGKDILIEAVNNNYGLVIFFIGIFTSLLFTVKSNMLPIFEYFIQYPTISIH